MSKNQRLANKDSYEAIKKYGMLLEINEDTVGKKYLQRQVKCLDRFDQLGSCMKGKLCFIYDEDFVMKYNAQLYLAPKVRTWAKHLFEAKPHIFYYLPEEEALFIFYCLIDCEQISLGGTRQVIAELNIARSWLERITKSAVAHSKTCGDSEQSQLELMQMLRRVL